MPETDWKAEYDWALGLVDEALALVSERDLVIVVLAAGYHPFIGAGLVLHERLSEDLRTGALSTPVTQDQVWRLAEQSGYPPDFTPIFRPPRPEET